MKPQRIGFLHPGAMGISLAASAQNSGCEVFWASEGRSDASRSRATTYGLHDSFTVDELCATCPVIVSICPPHAAESVAKQVIATGFQGLYLDANAIAPQRTMALGQQLAEAGIAFVDGGIIGGPAWKPKSTWLYLSGPRASEMASCFAAGPLETEVLDDAIGTASALKMSYAAYSKGTTALLCAILATAEQLHVREALELQWERDQAGFASETNERVRNVTAKAWRFVGEMDEIAATFRAAGLPREFHEAAAEVYRRLSDFKGAATTPELNAVLGALLAHNVERTTE